MGAPRKEMRRLAAAHGMPYAARPDSLDGPPSGAPYDMLPAIVFLDRLRNRASPHTRETGPVFFICPSDAVPDVPQ